MASNLRGEVEELYYLEAELLDDRRFDEWVDLFTDDARYWVPARQTTTTGELADEFAKPGEIAYMDESKRTLQMRVDKLRTGISWAEVPPSRTRHIVSNVRVRQNGGGEIEARSNFICYRSRLETEQDLYVGERADVLRRVDGALRIAKRTVLLDETVLSARNISVFL